MSKAARIVAAVVVTVAAIVTLNPQLIQAAIALDASVIAGALAPKLPRVSSGSETRWTADPRVGIPYAVGRCALAGDRRFERSAPVTGSNKFKNVISVYTVGPIQAYETFTANNVAVPFTADSGEGASGYYLNRMWMKRQYGVAHEPYLHWTATGSKDTPANHGGMPPQWTAAHGMSGYAACLWGAEWDPAKYAGGVMPPPLQVGQWVLVYDPRLDSTYPGGVGPCRYADPSDKAAYLAAKATWVWSDDPNLHGLQWALGAWTGDPDYPDMPLVQTHGLGLEIEDVDVAAYVEAANVSLANAWKIGGRVYSTDDPWEVLKSFLQAGGAEPVLLGDRLSCFVNTPKVSVATLRGRDAVGEVSLDAAVPFNERINTVWPSWTVEELNWEVTPAPAPVQVQAYIDDDQGVRSKELSVPLIQSPVHAGQITRYWIEDSRELGNIVIPVPPKWGMWLEPGLCITADEPEWCLNGQKLIIRKRVFDPSSMVDILICRTETDGKHAFALGQTATPPDTPALTGVDPNVVPLPAEDAWAVVGGVVAGESGSLPGIVIAGELDLYDAVSIVVDYRRVAPTVGEWKSAVFPASSRTLVVQGVEPGATYQVRVRYITAKGVENPANNVDLGTILVGGVDAGTVAGRPAGDVLDDIDIGQLNVAAAEMRGATYRAETDLVTGNLRQVIEQLGVVTGQHTVFITLMQSVDGDTGIAKAVLSLNSDGHIIGTVAMNDGTTGSYYVVADEFGVVGTDPLAPIKVFFVDTVTGKVRFRADVEIDGDLAITGSFKTASLQDNAVSNRVREAKSTPTSGTGFDVTEFTETFVLPHDADIEVMGNCNFLDGGGNGPSYHSSAIRLFINGVQVAKNPIAGAQAMQQLGTWGGAFCTAGSVTVHMTCMTKPDDSYDDQNFTFRWFYK